MIHNIAHWPWQCTRKEEEKKGIRKCTGYRMLLDVWIEGISDVQGRAFMRNQGCSFIAFGIRATVLSEHAIRGVRCGKVVFTGTLTLGC